MTTISLKQLVDMHTEVESLFTYFDSLPQPLPDDLFKAKLAMIHTRVDLKHIVERATRYVAIEVTE
jgi:hypothetical protein